MSFEILPRISQVSQKARLLSLTSKGLKIGRQLSCALVKTLRPSTRCCFFRFACASSQLASAFKLTALASDRQSAQHRTFRLTKTIAAAKWKARLLQSRFPEPSSAHPLLLPRNRLLVMLHVSTASLVYPLGTSSLNFDRQNLMSPMFQSSTTLSPAYPARHRIPSGSTCCAVWILAIHVLQSLVRFSSCSCSRPLGKKILARSKLKCRPA